MLQERNEISVIFINKHFKLNTIVELIDNIITTQGAPTGQ